MPQTLDSARRSLLLQRLTACLIWTLVVVKATACLWITSGLTLRRPWNTFKALFSPQHWAYTIGLTLLQAPVILAHSALISPVETQPLQLPGSAARLKRAATLLVLKWTPTSWLRALQANQQDAVQQRPVGLLRVWESIPHINFQHVLGRHRCWKQVIKALLFAFALVTSAVLSLPLLQSARSSRAGKVCHTYITQGCRTVSLVLSHCKGMLHVHREVK